MKRRIFAVLLAACLTFTCSISAYADEPSASVTQEEQTDEGSLEETEEGLSDDGASLEETKEGLPDDESGEVSKKDESDLNPEEEQTDEPETAPADEEFEGAELLGTMRLNSAPAPERETVKIISANVYTTTKEALVFNADGSDHDRGAILKELIENVDADSVGLCEVTGTWNMYLQSVCTDEWNYAIAGEVSCSGKKLMSGSSEYSPILYNTDLYELVEDGGWWLSAAPDTEGSRFVVEGHPDMQFARVFSYAVLKSRATGEIAYIHINAHYDHKCDDLTNQMCSQLVAEKAEYLKGRFGAVPIVITGDHNCDESSFAYRYLADSTHGFTDAKYMSDERDNMSTNVGFNENYLPELASKSIDHIFVSVGNVGVVQSRVFNNKYFSDHSAIMSELVFGNENVPVISAISCSENASLDTDLTGRNIYAETADDTLTFAVNANGTLFVNGNETENPVSLSLNDGTNEFSLVVEGNRARTEYKLVVNKTSGTSLPVVTEIFPDGRAPFFEITNLGEGAMNISAYEFYCGNSRMTINGDRVLKPGESVCVCPGGASAMNNIFTKGFNDAEVLSVDAAFKKEAPYEITVKKNDVIVSRSDYSGYDPANKVSRSYKFALVDGVVTAGLFPYDVTAASPCRYESDLGFTVKDPFSGITAGHADAFGGGAFNEDDRIASAAAGSFAYYTNVDFGDKAAKSIAMNCSVKGSNGGGTITVYLDGGYDGTTKGAKKIAKIQTTETHRSNWSVFADFTANLMAEVTGVHNLLLVFTPDKGKTYVANIATVTFSEDGTVVPDDDPEGEEYNPDSARIIVESELATELKGGKTADGEEKTPSLQKSNYNISPHMHNSCNILGNVVNGSSVVYKNVDFGETGFKGFGLTIAIKNSNCGGTMHVYDYDAANKTKGDEIARITVTRSMGISKDYNNYLSFPGELLDKNVRGVHSLLVEFEVTPDNKFLGNMDYFWFDKDLRNPYEKIEAESLDEKEGSKTQIEGEVKVSGLKSDSVLVYKNVNFEDGGVNSLVLHMAPKATTCGGTVNVYITDEGHEKLVGSCEIKAADKQTYSDYKDYQAKLSVKDIKGIHDVIIKTTLGKTLSGADATWVGHFDWFKFEKGPQDPDPEPEPEPEPEIDESEYAKVVVQCELAVDIKGGYDKANKTEKEPNLQNSGKVKSTFSYEGYNILGTTVDGSSAVYRNVDFGTSGIRSFWLNEAIKNTNCDGIMKVYDYDCLTAAKGEEIANITITREMGVAGNYNNYLDYEGTLLKKDITGVHDLLVTFEVSDGNSYVGNMDYFWFERNVIDAYEKIEAEWLDLNDSKRAQIEKEFKVSNLDTGAELVYKGVNFKGGILTSLTINASMNKDNNGGTADIFVIDGSEEIKLGTITFKADANQTYNDFKDYRLDIPEDVANTIKGVHDVVIRTVLGKRLSGTAAKWVAQFDWLKFERKLPANTEPEVFVEKNYKDSFGYLPYMHDAPVSLNSGEDFAVALKYSPLTDGTKVFLYYNKRADGSSFKKVEMVRTEGNEYTATIPGSAITEGGGLTYYFAEEGAIQYTDVTYSNGVEGYAFRMSDMYYVPIVSAGTPEYPELLITELNTQDKKGNAMEYVVLHNTTDRRLNLRDYTLRRYWYEKGYGNAYTFTGSDPVYIEADSSLVLWKNTGSYTLNDLNTYYYGSTLSADDVVLIKGDQFPTTTGYGLTLFKGDKEICSVMWRYTDTYCTDGNVKFAPTCRNATALGIIDNSTDNEAVNFLGVKDSTAVSDAARIFELPKDSDKTDALPGMTAHGVRISWTKNGNTLKAVFSRGGESTEKTYAADGSDRPGTIFVVGDSITQFYKMPDYPRDGWGAELGNYISGEGLRIRNYGKSGRSTNTFFAEKNFYDMLDAVYPGDAVLIQLCTNDCGSSAGVGVSGDHYQILLGYMFAAILEKGATPVMIGSACTHPQTGNGFADQPEIREYNALAHEVAELYQVPEISLYDITKHLMQTEGYDGMKDIMQYADAGDLRYLDDPAYYTYTETFLKESKTDKFHYSKYGSEILAKAVMSGIKEILPAFADGIDLSYEPVRKYYRTLSFNGTAASRDSYGAEYEGQVTVEFDLGAAPAGTVTIDGAPIASGSTYRTDGSHVLKIYIDDNNINEIPFTIRNGEKTVTENTPSAPSSDTGDVADNEQENEVQNMQIVTIPAVSETPGRISGGTPGQDDGNIVVNNEPAVTVTETEQNVEIIKDEDTALSEKPDITEETGTSEVSAETSDITDDEIPLAAEAKKSGFNTFFAVAAILAILAVAGVVSVDYIKARKIK